jgi:hypothetical protein
MTQLKIFRFLKTFSLIAVSCASLSAYAGGGMSGGGFGAPNPYDPSSLILVDYLANSDVASEKAVNGEVAPLYRDILFEGVREIKTLAAHKLAASRIEKWKKEYTVLAKILEHYLSTMTWNFTESEIGTPSETYVYSNPNVKARVRPVLYFDYCRGVSASIKDFGQFTMLSQAGAMIHESFRQIQIRKSFNSESINTSIIQRMVTLLMFSEPKLLSQTDRDLFLVFKTTNLVQVESKLKTLKSSYCKSQDAVFGPQEICASSTESLVLRKDLGKVLSKQMDYLEIAIVNSSDLSKTKKLGDVLDQVFDVIDDLVEINVNAATVEYNDATVGLNCAVDSALLELRD